MKFNFKIQQYQTDAVEAIAQVFNGQVKHEKGYFYRHDIGKRKVDAQGTLEGYAEEVLDIGYGNEHIQLADGQILENINKIQDVYNVMRSGALDKTLGRCSLDIEMETGTGKTYVYIKTMFELNKRYGWSKFIVVVPSIAIREGVKKSFEMLEEHFMEHYGQKARFFIYNSSNLNQLDGFATNTGINVMIINTQAFATSLKEDGKSKEARIIYSKRDEFGSRRPIDVISATHPILIMDEPQKMGGAATQKALKQFKPLFSIYYSATHKEEHNKVYVLDALDAYNKKLVKRIEVKGFELKNLRGTNGYMFLERIVLSQKKPPMARLEYEVAHKNGLKRETHIVGYEDNLYALSNGLEQYKDGYTISDINPATNTVTFLNGLQLVAGEAVGNVAEKDMRRIQIRETILSHFEKEEELFKQGIKTLSLFFIDEVAKYRQYDEDGTEQLGEYGVIFEEEYQKIFNDRMQQLFDTNYGRYLKRVAEDVSAVHKGYFSIDKKTNRSVDCKLKRGEESSSDESAYDLILKNKERLLSFDEPTRFIFSHSALREGWDNPNVFQICTLKHSDSTTTKRQEVGRGMRLCVNQDGNRMDVTTCGDRVHDINLLTVVASESYKDFVTALQNGDDGIAKSLYNRPAKASVDYFKNRTVTFEGTEFKIDEQQANAIYKYLIRNDYIDDDDKVTEKYKTDAANNTLAPVPDKIEGIAPAVHVLVQSIFDEKVLANMFTDGRETQVVENPLNKNFDKDQFQALWKRINHKYAYTVSFDSEELVRKAVRSIVANLRVTQITYTTTVGEQEENLQAHEVAQGTAFKVVRSRTQALKEAQGSIIKYDLIGQLAAKTTLTRKTVAKILRCLPDVQLCMFKANPEEFITKTARLINEQKATLIVEHVTYNQIEGEYEASIFTEEKSRESFAKAFKADKHIQDYVFTDGYAEKSVERRFAEALDAADEVCVYAKLPRAFKIPTPVGNYSPDWAIAFNKDSVKHIYFIAETKGTLESLQLKPIEMAKISCARKLFNDVSDKQVRYDVVDGYDELYNLVAGLSEPSGKKVINYDDVKLPEMKMVAEEREKW